MIKGARLIKQAKGTHLGKKDSLALPPRHMCTYADMLGWLATSRVCIQHTASGVAKAYEAVLDYFTQTDQKYAVHTYFTAVPHGLWGRTLFADSHQAFMQLHQV